MGIKNIAIQKVGGDEQYRRRLKEPLLKKKPYAGLEEVGRRIRTRNNQRE